MVENEGAKRGKGTFQIKLDQDVPTKQSKKALKSHSKINEEK